MSRRIRAWLVRGLIVAAAIGLVVWRLSARWARPYRLRIPEIVEPQRLPMPTGEHDRG